MTFLNRRHTLAYYSPIPRSTWEFVPEGETLERWTRLFRVVDYAEAKTSSDVHRISQGLVANYKQNQGHVLKAQTMTNAQGVAFDFLVAAFDLPEQKQVDIHFVKVFLGPTGGVAQMYSARVGDFLDYRAAAKTFLEHETGPIGHELGESDLPTPNVLPRSLA